MRDFTFKIYRQLLETALHRGYKIITFKDYLEKPDHHDRFIIMRHDVDRRPQNALATAKLEHELGVKASYYFRSVKVSFRPAIIKTIAGLGHEIGYHYEDLDLCRGDYKKAYDSFSSNLAGLRKLYPVKTIAMHGSPLSAWDNRQLWQKYDYRDLGITGEPYLDLDFDRITYLTDTGRRWDGNDVSIRDRVDREPIMVLRSTHQLINAIATGILPERIMINSHPERWDNALLPWLKQLIWQNAKNLVKKIIIRHK